MIFTTLGIFCLASLVSGAKLPPEVKLCHRSDLNFLECLRVNIIDGVKIFSKGYKELGIPKLEPFFIEKIEIQGDSSRRNSIEQKYKNVYIHGSSNFDIKNLNLDIDSGCGWEFDEITPKLTMTADYSVQGQILVFPLNSSGKCNITQYNLVNHNKMTCEKYTKNDKVHIRITDYKVTLKPEKIEYYFENIFPGNEQISSEILKTLNENSLDIFEDVKEGFEQVFDAIYKNTGNSVFSKIPLKDIFLD